MPTFNNNADATAPTEHNHNSTYPPDGFDQEPDPHGWE